MDPPALSAILDALQTASPMLGHKLEDRARIRDAQAPELVRAFHDAGRMRLRSPLQRALFLCAPLDILVVGATQGKRFHIIETNGTGIGGLTNLPLDVVSIILSGLSGMAQTMAERAPLVLVAVSGLESSKNPRRNHLLQEKVLYAEALKEGFAARGDQARVLTMAALAEQADAAADAVSAGGPTIVLGYIKEFLDALSAGRDGRLSLLGRPVAAAVNDRFCLNVVSRFGGQVDLRSLATMNRCFMAGADKGVAYDLLNEYARANPSRFCPNRIEFARAAGRAELIAGIVDWLKRGRRVVIKPQGTGLGHGLEFFVDAEEPLDAIVGKVDHSIRVTEHYYGAVGGAFPYTLCEFVDTCMIAKPDHALSGHKYELRVVVYRDGLDLCALPSIAKVSSHGYDADKPARLSLINNITTSAEAKKREGVDFMLPLCNRETLELLELDVEALKALGAYCTGYVSHLLDICLQQPERLALPVCKSVDGKVINGQIIEIR